MRINGILVVACLFLHPISAFASVNFESEFGQRKGCFLISDLATGKIISEFNNKQCQERISPCSSFKIAAAAMAYDQGVLKDENQVIKWDGVKRSRSEENHDQTPLTWMSESVKWVTEWIMPQLGEKKIQHFLDSFNYGNKDFSGGLKDSWVTSSLKISAHEQLDFISKLWKNELPISKHAADLTKKIIFVKKLGKNSELYGKTGTGCLEGHGCMEHPDKMLGWFVGVLKVGAKEYAFAANALDEVPQTRPGGPRTKDTTIEILEKMQLVE